MEGLAAARRASAAASTASFSGRSTTAMVMATPPRRRNALASCAMGFRWPTPKEGYSTTVFSTMAFVSLLTELTIESNKISLFLKKESNKTRGVDVWIVSSCHIESSEVNYKNVNYKTNYTDEG
ncbi:hypothetical protein SEVIR_5G311851v4 [Setaria viridis]